MPSIIKPSVTKEQLQTLSTSFGFAFPTEAGPALLEALSSRGSRGASVEGNRRLAMVGDAALKDAYLMRWYDDEPSTCEIGNSCLAVFLSNKSLPARGEEIGLDAHIRTNKGSMGVSPKMIATAVEAVFGVIRRHGGPGAVDRAMTHLGLLPTEEEYRLLGKD